MPSKWARCLFSILLAASFGCGSTTDSLGDSKQPTVVLRPLTGPAKYKNAFKDLLGKSDTEIDSKISQAFKQLFHGDPTNEAIYFLSTNGNYADIRDILHDDLRTEGYGLAMLITVEYDKQTEFDNIWRGALQRRSTSGASKGYFNSKCDVDGNVVDCLDPFGLQQFVMALILANDRWKDLPTTTIDYAAAAIDLLSMMRNIETVNGGVVDGITNTFDKATKAVFDVPNANGMTGVGTQKLTRPSLQIPGYYALWAQATGDSFFSDAALAARQFLNDVAHPVTGLTPVRANLDGTLSANYDTFQAECYRVQLNLMLDAVWTESKDGVAASTHMLDFFSSQGKDSSGSYNYGSQFSLDGTNVINTTREASLVLANGMTALISNNNGGDRVNYINAVWNMTLATGKPRYFPGLMYMLALLSLSGYLRVY